MLKRKKAAQKEKPPGGKEKLAWSRFGAREGEKEGWRERKSIGWGGGKKKKRAWTGRGHGGRGKSELKRNESSHALPKKKERKRPRVLLKKKVLEGGGLEEGFSAKRPVPLAPGGKEHFKGGRTVRPKKPLSERSRSSKGRR